MSREFVAEFILLYENEPCLWQVGSKHYHDKNKKEAAYKKLLEKLKVVDAKATKDDVIKKINNMRSALRKENKKIKESLKSGASTDSVYKPKLWYFSMLSFLSQDIPRTSRSNLDSDDDDLDEEKTSEIDVPNTQDKDESTQNYLGISNQSVAGTSTSAPPTPQRQLRKRGEKKYHTKGMAKEVLVHENEYFKKPRTEEDRFDVIGKGFAIKLRGLPKEQMLLAEKLMNDTLFQAEMGSLNMSHRVVGEPHTNRVSRYFSQVSYQDSAESCHTSLSCPSHATTEKQRDRVIPHQINQIKNNFGP